MNSELTNGEVKQLIGKLMQKENGLEDFASTIGVPDDEVRKLFTEILSSPNMSDDAKKFVWNGDDKILQAFVKCTSSTRRNDMADQPVRVRTEKELTKAVESGVDTIEIEFPLGDKVIRIKGTGQVAWGVCIAALAVSLVAVLATPATGGSSNVAHFVTLPVATTILGGPVACSAMAIAVAAGGIGVLNKLRKYKIEKQSGDVVVLRRKK